jgi:hypothetical protein
MYLQQNETSGLAQCLELARAGETGPSPVALVANHWRTAENEIAIGYLAEAAYHGATPDAFYARWCPALVGWSAASEVTAAYQAIDDWGAYAVEHLFNMGFCFLGCWRNVPRMGWVYWWRREHVLAYRDGLLAAAARLEATLPAVARPAGLERCRLLINRLQASAHHCDAIFHLLGMNARVQAHDPGELPEADMGAFLAHARAAQTAANCYLALSAEMLPDRGAEGTLTSYAHVILGFIEYNLEAYLGSEAGAVPVMTVDGPPSPATGGR